MTVVIVGGSLGGLHTAEGLRAQGYSGPITVVDAHPFPHDDRPPMSKEYLAGSKDARAIALRSDDKLAALNVEWRLGQAATGVDLATRRVHLDDGTALPYGALVVATGVTAAWPEQLKVPGALTLRTREDSDRLRQHLRPGARLVVIGAGFVGLEVAATFRTAGAEVDVVEAEATPLQRHLGADIGRAMQHRHEAHGVRFHLGMTATPVPTADGHPGVHLGDGTVLEADVLLVAVGSQPSTGWLAGSGLELGNGVGCDAGLRAAPGVWAVGDTACWPHALVGRRVRIEHWTNAIEQAAFVATAIASPDQAPRVFDAIPYFWSDHYGGRLQAHGFPSAEDELEVVSGDLASEKFTVALRRNGRMTAVVGLASPRQVIACRRDLVGELRRQEAMT